MTYEDFENEFIKILTIVAENSEKFESDMFTTFEELLMINSRKYECWMHPGIYGYFGGKSTFFALTIKKIHFTYFYCLYLNSRPEKVFPLANPKGCKIAETPKEIYDNYPDPEKLISIMNKWVMERI